MPNPGDEMILIRVRRVSQLQESFPAIKKPKQLEKRKSISVRVLEKFIGSIKRVNHQMGENHFVWASYIIKENHFIRASHTQ